MSDTNNRPLPDGSLRGDNKPMRNVGTETGVTDAYGADLSLEAKNVIGKITAFTKSDAPADCYADDPLHPDADDGY